MKKIFALLLSVCILLCLAACGGGDAESSIFVPGEELSNPLGDNFKLPLNGDGLSDEFVTIVTLKAVKQKEADVNNLEDYEKNNNGLSFFRYLYDIEISGYVDKKFAGEEIAMTLFFGDNPISFLQNANVATVGADGTFQMKYTAYSNLNESVIMPRSANLRPHKVDLTPTNGLE